MKKKRCCSLIVSLSEKKLLVHVLPFQNVCYFDTAPKKPSPCRMSVAVRRLHPSERKNKGIEVKFSFIDQVRVSKVYSPCHTPAHVCMEPLLLSVRHALPPPPPPSALRLSSSYPQVLPSLVGAGLYRGRQFDKSGIYGVLIFPSCLSPRLHNIPFIFSSLSFFSSASVHSSAFSYTY